MAHVGRGPRSLVERAIGPMVGHAVATEMAALRGALVSELIGRQVDTSTQKLLYSQRATVKSVDETQPDYAFWDRLRRVKAKGYLLAGLFAKRIERTYTHWVLGRGVDVVLAKGGDPGDDGDARTYTDRELAGFIGDNKALLMRLYQDHLGLGDQYVIINADGSLSVPPPNTVDVERDEFDYRQVLAVTVTTKLEPYTITDEYRPDSRTVTIKKGADVVRVDRYANLIGRIPFVHLAWDRGPNETNGHPIHEELLPLFSEYDDLAYKQLDGAKLLGNPIPTLTGLSDPRGAIADHEAEEPDEMAASHDVIKLDANPVVALGDGADFKMVAPPTGFTADTKTALKSLFLLLLDHTGIPEFLWGNELSSARASAEVQLEQWVKDSEARQESSKGWIKELCTLWLLMRSLVDPRVVVDELTAKFPALVDRDAELRLKSVAYVKDRDLIRDQTTLEILGLPIEDAQREVDKARQEAEERRAREFPDGDPWGFTRRLEAEGGEDE